MKNIRKWAQGLLALAVAATTGSAALAREPGVPPSLPPGASMGVPVGATPPPGVYFSSRNGYADFELNNGSGDPLGADVTIKSTVAQFLWVPGNELFGGKYRALLTLPFINIDQTVTGMLPLGTGDKLSLSNVQVTPIDISWQLQPGIFMNAGLAVFLPQAGWSQTEPAHNGGNFWTFAPNAGFSYMRDGWNATLHALYLINTENKDNSYKSGNEFMLNATLMKNFDGISFGPVGYYRAQVTDDENNGTYLGGNTVGKARQLAVGLSVTKRIGKVDVNAMYTHDVYHYNTLGGDKFWLNFTVPLGKK